MNSGSTENARLENRTLFKILFKLLYLHFPPLQIRTCVFRTCIFHPCVFVLTYSVLAYSILRYFRFPYLRFQSPPFPGLPRWAGTRKVKPIWILQKQETVSGSGISWAICKSAPCSRQITTPAPHHSVFYRPDALPAAQPIASKHWRHKVCLNTINKINTCHADYETSYCCDWRIQRVHRRENVHVQSPP